MKYFPLCPPKGGDLKSPLGDLGVFHHFKKLFPRYKSHFQAISVFKFNFQLEFDSQKSHFKITFF